MRQKACPPTNPPLPTSQLVTTSLLPRLWGAPSSDLLAAMLVALALDIGRLGWRRTSARRCPATGGLHTEWWGHELSAAVFRLLVGLHGRQLGHVFLAGLPDAGVGGEGLLGDAVRLPLLLFSSGAPALLLLWCKPVRPT